MAEGFLGRFGGRGQADKKHAFEVALSEEETKTSSGAPASIADASAVEPPDLRGATCTPVLELKPLSKEVTSGA